MKNVLITGGSRGIGRAMVELFSKRGYRVAFTYLTSCEAASKLSEKTGALAIRADCAIEADVTAAIEKAFDFFGDIEVLINNAAISSIKPISDVSLEEWNRTFAVNVTGAFLYSKGVLSQMLKKKCGRIINVASMWGLVGSSCETHYSASKAALIGFTKALAKELGPSGITVNAIAPGVIKTEMNALLSAEDISALEDETPVGRLGNPSEVAEAAFYLASPEAAFITGEVLNISGGFVV